MDISICIITYNQKDYVAQAIESALAQKCNFNYQIIISDDGSMDGTKEIIANYAAKYPDLIKAFYADTNIGMLKNWAKALMLCKGRYIALLEGDDFWNDHLKLQKQYRILEDKPDCSISFTNAFIVYENNPDGYPYYVTKTAEYYSIADLLEYNFIPTCSVLMRNNISEKFFPDNYFKSPFADWIIHFLNAQNGRIHFLNEFTCTYRVHDNGVWGGIAEERQLYNRVLALALINDIATEKNQKQIIKMSRKKALQDLCFFYKKRGDRLNYLKFRLKLILL